MTVLSDFDITRLLSLEQGLIYPFDPSNLQPASYDIHLGNTLKKLPTDVVLDPEKDQSASYKTVDLGSDGRWRIEKGRGYLGVVAERILVPDDHVVFLHGVSSLGRLFLLVHATAGLADPGFDGNLTLELISLAGPMYLRPGMRIGQLTYHKTLSDPLRRYDGRYQHDTDPVPSRSFKDTVER